VIRPIQSIARSVACLVTLLALYSCSSGSGIRDYWKNADVIVTGANFEEAQERFAGFASLAEKAPVEEVEKAVDELLDKAMADEVSYFVYSEWLVSIFHSLLSPCRNPALLEKCAERFRSDGIMTEGDYTTCFELAAKDRLNTVGSECSLPVPFVPGEETVYVVINPGCSSCISTLKALSDKPGRHVALCFGSSVSPDISGWEFVYPQSPGRYFDLDSAPFWFTVGPDGIVTTTYAITEGPDFKKPQKQ